MVERIIFDVDGTLLSKEEKLRPGCLSVFKALRAAGIVVALWSGHGVRYSHDWAHAINPDGDLELRAFPKDTAFLDRTCAVVDDDMMIVEVAECFHARAFLVPYYDPDSGTDDDELYRILDKILDG